MTRRRGTELPTRTGADVRLDRVARDLRNRRATPLCLVTKPSVEFIRELHRSALHGYASIQQDSRLPRAAQLIVSPRHPAYRARLRRRGRNDDLDQPGLCVVDQPCYEEPGREGSLDDVGINPDGGVWILDGFCVEVRDGDFEEFCQELRIRWGGAGAAAVVMLYRGAQPSGFYSGAVFRPERASGLMRQPWIFDVGGDQAVEGDLYQQVDVELAEHQ